MTDYIKTIMTGRSPSWLVAVLLLVVLVGDTGIERVMDYYLPKTSTQDIAKSLGEDTGKINMILFNQSTIIQNQQAFTRKLSNIMVRLTDLEAWKDHREERMPSWQPNSGE